MPAAQPICRISIAFALALCVVGAGWCAEKDVAEPLKAAQKLLWGGKYAEAAEAFEKLQASLPQEAAVGVAHTQVATGKLAEAEEGLRKAVAAQPKSGALEAELGQLLFARGEYKEAGQAAQVALELDENSLSARWLSAELSRVQGDLPAAGKGYKWLVDYYNAHDLKDPQSLRYVGLAAAQFARWNRISDQFSFLVNDLYPEALELEPSYWPARYESGLLFLEKFNEADATKEIKAALALNANAADVHAAAAALAVQNYELGEAEASIARALEINPNCLAAHLAQADVHMANIELDKALATLEAARPLNPRSDGTLGRLAAVYWALDGAPQAGKETRLSKLIAEVTAANEHAGEFYVTLADSLDRLQRYPAAAENYATAIERMPQLGAARGKWGLVLMRLGNEAEGKKLLDDSFDADPFNVRVSNTLKVLEVLDGYQTLESDHFVIKYDGQRDKILARYASRWLEQVYPQLCQQLAFEPPQKSLFEIFNRAKNTDGHGWFSARMVGLPHIHTIGACAGKMVAMQSPNEKGQEFNWARVLKHEFVHVINLQQTHFTIPHWYTEALAVLNEGYPRPQSWNDLLVERVPAGKIFNLDDINLGFIRAHSSDEWALAYCQAELYAEYMLEKYGDDSLAKMLSAYADNLSTREALKRSFDVSQDDFEKGYRQHLEKIVAGLTARKKAKTYTLAELQKELAADPKNPELLAQMALQHLSRRGYPEARRLAEKALSANPKQQLASYVRARLHMVVGEDQEAHKLLVAALDPADPQENLLGLLAGLELASEHYDEAARLYELGAKVDPSDTKWIKSLARVYLKSNQKDKLAEVLTRLAEIEPDDATVRKKLAELAHAAKDHAATERWCREVLQIDVMDPQNHGWLADSLAAQAKPAEAADEYEVAVELNPEEPGLRFNLAQAWLDAKQPDKAKQALEELLKLDPKYPGADLLLEGLKP